MKNRRWLAVITAISLMLSCSGLCFAQQGVMSGAGKLRVTQTQWFDIIYSEKNSATAQILYENADDIYREIAASYGIEPYFRLPVVITSTVEQFNAYATTIPYNCIVMFDTAMLPELAVFSQTVISLFTHELTHIITYNHKDSVSRFLAKLFGDGFAGFYLTVTSGMAEGATVSYESSKGEGRLNDAYVLQMLRQAKIEESFPSYSDVKGASDAYPANSYYYFNGAFAEYLQRNYGMEKYAEFWYRCVNIKNLTAAGAFKKTYGIKLDKAWQNFENELFVPNVSGPNPVKQGQVKDFFASDLQDYSIRNNAGSLYSNLCSSDKGIYYIDGTHSSVYFVSAEQLASGEEIKPQKLFRHDYIDYLRVSADGRFAAVGYYSTLSSNLKHRAAIYDFETKSWFTIPDTNIVAPSVIMDQGQYYFVCQKYEPQKYSICVKKILIEGKVTGVQDFAIKDFAPEEMSSEFTALGDGHFAFIKKQGMNYFICVSPLDCSSITEYAAPVERMKIRSLSAGENGEGISFSWATKETLPRYGFLDLDQQQFCLSQENISGGVYNPVLREGKLFYIGQFYKQNRLFFMDYNAEVGKELLPAVGLNEELELAEREEGFNLQGDSAVELPYKPFSPLQYAFEGLLLPFSTMQPRLFASTDSIGSGSIGLGLTFITSLPWNSGIFILSGGYDIPSHTGGFSFDYSGGTETPLFNYALEGSVALDEFGFKQTHGGIYASSSFDFGTRSAFGVQLQAGIDYGNLTQGTDYIKSVQAASVSYSNLVKAGPGTYERTGFAFTPSLLHNYEYQVRPMSQEIMDYYELAFSFTAYIPKLLPVICPDNFTWNLPLKLYASLFDFQKSQLVPVNARAEMILFAYDIQKAVPFVSAIFINSVNVSLKYYGSLEFPDSEAAFTSWRFLQFPDYIDQLKSGRFNYIDYAAIKLSLGLTPNVGGFATTEARLNLYFSYCFGKPQNLPDNIFEIGLEGKF